MRVHVWTDPERLLQEVEELGMIEAQVVPRSVAEHLQTVRAIVALELGFSQLETMVEVIGFEVAYWLARTYRGVIKGANDAWFDHGAHRWEPIED